MPGSGTYKGRDCDDDDDDDNGVKPISYFFSSTHQVSLELGLKPMIIRKPQVKPIGHPGYYDMANKVVVRSLISTIIQLD